ncbi:MAG: LemA family protein [Verrucomicrobiota bacterium]
MKKGLLVLLVLGGLAVLLVLAGRGTYNGLVGKREAVDSQWGKVSNQYQRRADLVPNLVKTVQGSADFEKSVLKEVTEARASVGRVTMDASNAPDNAAKLQEFQKAQGDFGAALSRLLVVAERYPDLKASAGFRDLQVQLEGTENRIAVERGRFNEVAQTYNTSVRGFPTVIFAGMLGFQPKPYFEAQSGAEKPPEVNFDFSGKPATE